MITMSAFPPVPSSVVPTAASTEPPFQWNVEELYSLLAPLLPDLSIEVVAEIGSTNTALLERARVANRLTNEGDLAQVRRSAESLAFGRRSADHQPCLLIAEHQTQGRGRLGRAWQSAPGSSAGQESAPRSGQAAPMEVDEVDEDMPNEALEGASAAARAGVIASTRDLCGKFYTLWSQKRRTLCWHGQSPSPAAPVSKLTLLNSPGGCSAPAIIAWR
jgi:hypothetical protein